MARGRASFRGNSPFTLMAIAVGSAAFALGLLSPTVPPRAVAKTGRPAKTHARVLADGTDISLGAWVGVAEPSLGKAAFAGTVHAFVPSTRLAEARRGTRY